MVRLFGCISGITPLTLDTGGAAVSRKSVRSGMESGEVGVAHPLPASLKSSVRGIVLDVAVAERQTVSEGDLVAVLQEGDDANRKRQGGDGRMVAVTAHKSGRVTSLAVQRGSAVAIDSVVCAIVRPLASWAQRECTQFYDETWRSVLGHAKSLISSSNAAEDLMYDTYVLAMVWWEDLLCKMSPEQRMRWMRTTLQRLAIEKYRNIEIFKKYAPKLYEPDRSRAPDPEDAALAAVTADQCLKTIRTMSPTEQAVSRLRWEDGYSTAQIAEILDMNINTVRGVLKTVRDKLLGQVGSALTFEPKYGERGTEGLTS